MLVLADYWTCALLRAELIERGYEPRCVASISAALVSSSPAAVGAPAIVVAEQAALSDRDCVVFAWLRALGSIRASALISSAGVEPPPEGWERVLRRPVSLGEIADVVDELAREPGRSGVAVPPGFELRMGWPWPTIKCVRCGTSRQCEPPRTPDETAEVRSALVMFALAHEPCGGR